MAAYTWSDDLATGNSLIDAQHKELIGAINALIEACGSGQGRASLDRTMSFLSDYTAKHFADEERLQQQYKYPGYIDHVKLHDAFKAQVKALAKDLSEQGPTIVLVGKVNTAIGGWLLAHIKREDTKVAAHIKSRNNNTV